MFCALANNDGLVKLKCLIVAVCYNSYDDLRGFLLSVDSAVQREKMVNVTIAIANNSDIKPDRGYWESLKSSNYILNIYEFKNVGYFPAFSAVMSSIGSKVQEFEYISICNVDLVLDERFFLELHRHYSSDDIGIIAPNIIDISSGRSLNPKISTRPSLRYLQLLGLIYSNPISFRVYYYLYDKLPKRIRKTAQNRQKVKTEFYAPHGAFIIFKQNYFLAGGVIDFPRLLFSEELFIGEQLRLVGLKISFAENILIQDTGHGSTSKLNWSFLSKQHFLSNEFIRREFYKDEF